MQKVCGRWGFMNWSRKLKILLQCESDEVLPPRFDTMACAYYGDFSPTQVPPITLILFHILNLQLQCMSRILKFYLELLVIIRNNIRRPSENPNQEQILDSKNLKPMKTNKKINNKLKT